MRLRQPSRALVVVLLLTATAVFAQTAKRPLKLDDLTRFPQRW
jgi:hypothetical protein